MILPRLRTATWYLSLLLLATATLAPARAQDEPKHPVNTLNGVVVRQSDGKPLAGVKVAMAHHKQAFMYIYDEPSASGPTKRVLFIFPRTNGRTACEVYTDDQGRFTLRSFVSLEDKYNIAVGSTEVGFALLTDVVPAEHQDEPLRIEVPEPAYLAVPAEPYSPQTGSQV